LTRRELIGGAIVASRSILGAVIGARLVPDTALYLGASGSTWFYPSPLGRALGELGYAGLAFTQVAAAFAIGAMLVRACGGSLAGAVLASASPIGWYFQPVSVDVLAAALVLGGVQAGRRLYGVGALLLHPASALGYFVSRSFTGGFAAVSTIALLAGITFAAVLMTPYAGIVQRASVDGIPPAVGSLLVLVVPIAFVLWNGYRLAAVEYRRVAVFSAVVATAVIAAQGHMQTRYYLPALVLAAASIRRREPKAGSSRRPQASVEATA